MQDYSAGNKLKNRALLDTSMRLGTDIDRPGDRGGYRQSRRNFARQGGFGQFWGADSEYGCYTKGCCGV